MRRVYRVLLYAYPNEFRRTYGVDMARVFDDRARELLVSHRRWTLASFVVYVVRDWIETVVRERLAALQESPAMTPMLVCLSLFSLAAGCWLALMESILRHPAFPQRIAIAALIVGQSALTLIAIAGSPRRVTRYIVGAGACALFAMGALAVLKNVRGPGFEGFALIIGLALIVQAILTLSVMLRGSRPASFHR
jgi:hypothetical protein